MEVLDFATKEIDDVSLKYYIVETLETWKDDVTIFVKIIVFIHRSVGEIK